MPVDFRNSLLTHTRITHHGILCRIRAVSNVDVRFLKRTIKVTQETKQVVACTAENVAGGGGGGAGGGGAAGDNGGAINQIGNAINNGINNIFGNGGNNGAAAPPPGAN